MSFNPFSGEGLWVVAIFVLLFGAKRLPDTARSLGRSLRILKAETKGLRDDDGDGKDDRTGEKMPAITARDDSDAR